MKHYILIEVDTECATIVGLTAAQLAEDAVNTIMAGAGSQLQGIDKIATYNIEHLHNEVCLLMDGVS